MLSCPSTEERLILSAGGFIRQLALLLFYNVTQLHYIVCEQIIICSVSLHIAYNYTFHLQARLAANYFMLLRSWTGIGTHM